jgi:hypothetical protein
MGLLPLMGLALIFLKIWGYKQLKSILTRQMACVESSKIELFIQRIRKVLKKIENCAFYSVQKNQ